MSVILPNGTNGTHLSATHPSRSSRCPELASSYCLCHYRPTSACFCHRLYTSARRSAALPLQPACKKSETFQSLAFLLSGLGLRQPPPDFLRVSPENLPGRAARGSWPNRPRDVSLRRRTAADSPDCSRRCKGLHESSATRSSASATDFRSRRRAECPGRGTIPPRGPAVFHAASSRGSVGNRCPSALSARAPLPHPHRSPGRHALRPYRRSRWLLLRREWPCASDRKKCLMRLR